MEDRLAATGQHHGAGIRTTAQLLGFLAADPEPPRHHDQCNGFGRRDKAKYDNGDEGEAHRISIGFLPWCGRCGWGCPLRVPADG
jgi:hypothetical protein